jgi:hypothetical protein
MHIPAPAQEMHLPLTQKLEVNPVVPVTAVAGIPEDAQNLDSRVALQWTQPVFDGAEGQATRSALVAEAKQVPAALMAYEPQGADPDALMSGEVHPLLAKGMSNWISSALANTTTPTILNPEALPKEASANLKNIYAALEKSNVFAAHKLNEAWVHRTESETAFTEPTAAQLTQWVAALEPDSADTQQAARMLTQGQMMWQTEWVPGVPLRIVREDAWRNHPAQLGQIEKGAMLRVEVDLPNLGKLKILGSQWGSDLSLQIAHAPSGSASGAAGQADWHQLTPSLLQELRNMGVQNVKVEEAPEDSADPKVASGPKDFSNG